MNTRFFRPSVATMAMLVAMCGYAAAQTAPQATYPAQNNQSAQQAPAAQGAQNMQLVSANAQLLKNVSTRNASEGQTVSARLTSSVKTADGVRLKKGTVLMGKVEQVQKSSSSSPAKLALVFDQARLKDGKTIPVKATLLGAYPANTSESWVDASAGGSLMPTESRTISPDEQVDQQPGALGHIALHSSVQSSASGVFTSKDRNVTLKRGTRLQIAIAPETMTASGIAGS